MTTRLRRANRVSARPFIESLEGRELLSAMGFATTVYPAGRQANPAASPAIRIPIRRGAAVSPENAGLSDPFTPLSAFSSGSIPHLLLNNFGYNAVEDARDSQPWSGSVGLIHLPVAFSPALSPQASISRAVPGGTETMFVVLDWGDGSPQTLGTFQSISPAAYRIGGSHTWTAPGDYRLTAFLVASGPGADLPFVLHKTVGVAHAEATPESLLPPIELHLPLYDPLHYVPPAYLQILLPTGTPTDDAGFTRVYDFIVGGA
jgi:hypothetical protein